MCLWSHEHFHFMNYFHWSQDDDAFSLCWLPLLGRSALLHYGPGYQHFVTAAAAISIVKKHHHLDFNGNISWNGNAHVTTGTSTIPYEHFHFMNYFHWSQDDDAFSLWWLPPLLGRIALLHYGPGYNICLFICLFVYLASYGIVDVPVVTWAFPFHELFPLKSRWWYFFTMLIAAAAVTKCWYPGP